MDNPAALDQNVNIDIGWEIPEDLDVVNGDTFAFDLPNVFKMYSTVNGTLIQDGVELGTYKIDTNGHVILTFNAEVEDRSEIKGTIKVATVLNKEIIEGETQQEIVFPVGDTEITVPIFLKPANLR